jgi:type IV pilus assembly protein PilZ
MQWMERALATEEQNTMPMSAIDIDDTQAAESGRIQPRKEIAVEVGVYAENQFYTGLSQNISSGGLFIGTSEPLEIGTTFELTFKIPNLDHSFKCSGEVRWVRTIDVASESGLNAGMGVRFNGLDPLEQKLIDQFIHGEDTLFFDDE